MSKAWAMRDSAPIVGEVFPRSISDVDPGLDFLEGEVVLLPVLLDPASNLD